MNEKDKNKRREILALGLIAGAGALAGAGIKAIVSEAQTRREKMITASGEVVEVEVRHLPKRSKDNAVSNADLKQWIESEKK
jgi:ferric-dicitrate binding protein FerR (iron transport regulator)